MLAVRPRLPLNDGNLDRRYRAEYPVSIVNNPRSASSLLIVFLVVGTAMCPADTMVKIRTVITDSQIDPNVANTSTTYTIQYRHGIMRRRDSLSAEGVPSFGEIANCETRTGFSIDWNAREYESYKVVKFASEAQRAEYLQKAGKTAFQVESKTVDTGERKMFFGHSAKHLITTTRRTAPNNPNDEEIFDGWYVDHELPDRNCAPDFVRSEPYYVTGTALVDYPDLAEVNHTGPLPTGLPVKLTLTSKIAGKKGTPRTITIEKTVEELSDSPLSPSLFELPKGFHENPQLWRGHSGSTR